VLISGFVSGFISGIVRRILSGQSGANHGDRSGAAIPAGRLTGNQMVSYYG